MPYPIILSQGLTRDSWPHLEAFLPLLVIPSQPIAKMKKQVWKFAEGFVSEDCNPEIAERIRDLGGICHVVQSPVWNDMASWKKSVLDRLTIHELLMQTRGRCQRSILGIIASGQGIHHLFYERMVKNALASGLIVANGPRDPMLTWIGNYNGKPKNNPRKKLLRWSNAKPIYAPAPVAAEVSHAGP